MNVIGRVPAAECLAEVASICSEQWAVNAPLVRLDVVGWNGSYITAQWLFAFGVRPYRLCLTHGMRNIRPW